MTAKMDREIVGAVRLSDKEYEKVLAFFERAVREEPGRWSYWCDIGFCHGKLGRWQEAAAAFEKLTDDAPEETASIHVLSLLGHAYIKLGRYQDAETVLNRAHRLEPYNLSVLYKLAVAYFQRGQAQLAVRPLQQIVGHKPQHLKAQYNLGLVLHQLGDQAGLERQIAILERLSPAQADRLRQMAGTGD